MFCFIFRLSLKQAHSKNKQRRRAGNNCAIVSRSGYIWIWSGARDQESTNHSAHFVGWKSSNITTNNLVLYSVLFNFGHICHWDQCAVYTLYSKISTDTGLLKIRHSHRFVAVVIQILIPFVFSVLQRSSATSPQRSRLVLAMQRNTSSMQIF